MLKKNPRLILLCGLPASGKTLYANKMKYLTNNSIIFSSDNIRKELYGAESIQGNGDEVFHLMHSRTVDALNSGYTVIYDATNITRKNRAAIISLCPKFVKIECHIIWTPIWGCINRDKQRDRTVGERIINHMVKRFQAPFYDEGIDEIRIIKPDYINNSYTYRYQYDNIRAMDIPHDNSHHTLNIWNHCCKAYNYINNKSDSGELALAALIHDIGKPYTKDFHDSKGNPSEEAHYYQHQCVGAWISYGYQKTTPYVAWLISTHMDMFLNTKYYKKLPDFYKRDLDLLHEADLNAH